MLLLKVASLVLAVASPAAAVWPIPQSMSTGNTTLLISENIAITYNDVPLTYTYAYEPYDVSDSRQLVQGGISRALSAIFQTGLVPWKLHRRNSLNTIEPSLAGANATATVRSLVITQTGANVSANASATTAVDESYNLTISATGEAQLTAVSSTGVLRGLDTFSQLFYKHSNGNAWYTTSAPIEISDAPKYVHRGVLLDVARNWFDVADLRRTIDAVSWNKMNRLHLHMTDSQSWPLDIPSMPEVAREGAYRSDLIYSASDLEGLQSYAAARGVDLIVEVDMPGHIGSLDWSHPELVIAYDAAPYYWWCAEPPCGAFKLNDTAVDAFLETLFDDLLPRIAPYTSYFHTGGDELNANDSRLDPGILSNDSDVLRPLLQRFIDTNHARVRAQGLTPIVWEEIPIDWNVTLGAGTIVQEWLGAASVKSLVAKGLQVIDSDYNYWYLDCGRGQWLAWDNGLAFETGYPFNDWCNPTKSWQLAYSHDPSDGLTEDEAKLILGGEAALWTETVDSSNLDSLLWPRGSAIAEVLWSGNTDPVSGLNRSHLEVAPRLNEWREVLRSRGVASAPVQMIWCTQADNSTECSYPM